MSEFFIPRRPPQVPADLIPIKPFVIGPEDYQIIDGDTIKVKWLNDLTLNIRFNTVDAPEVSRAYQDTVLQKSGVFVNLDLPGRRATKFLNEMIEARALMIFPSDSIEAKQRADRYGRLTGHIFVSGDLGPSFELKGARDVEKEMLNAGHAIKMSGQHFLSDTLEHKIYMHLGAGHDFTMKGACRINASSLNYETNTDPRPMTDQNRIDELPITGFRLTDNSPSMSTNESLDVYKNDFPSLRSTQSDKNSGPTF